MVNIVNKTVGYIVNPLAIGMLLVVVCLVLVVLRKRKSVLLVLGATIAWFWFWSMPVVGAWLALSLERDYPVQLAENMPFADAIVVMGGGVRGVTNHPYAMLKDGADRAWHAARLWKAGKAPLIIPSNVNAELCDIQLLVDLGVPKDAIILEDKAVNTEENARFVKEILAQKRSGVENSILLVTSACHMRRSIYMFEKYVPDIKCIPAATDYQAVPWKDEPFKWRNVMPDIRAFASNNVFIHEYIGYYGYRWFR